MSERAALNVASTNVARRARTLEIVDDELLTLAKQAIGNEFELSPEQSARLRGATAKELRDDAKLMRREPQLPALDEQQGDDERGRFTTKGIGMNRLIREASGR